MVWLDCVDSREEKTNFNLCRVTRIFEGSAEEVESGLSVREEKKTVLESKGADAVCECIPARSPVDFSIAAICF